MARQEDFVSHSGNPENGDYAEYARYLDSQTLRKIESNPRPAATDEPLVGHAKEAYRREALAVGVEWGPEGSLMHHPV